eukprot:1149497-Pelagomonas_calceolata.AAC.4
MNPLVYKTGAFHSTAYVSNTPITSGHLDPGPMLIYHLCCMTIQIFRVPSMLLCSQIVQDCLTLNKIAQALRAARFASGAVRLDNVRVAFGLDTNGNPVSCGQYVQQEANKLVEEFMLLTNISVAKIISAAFPDRALLRWVLVLISCAQLTNLARVGLDEV